MSPAPTTATAPELGPAERGSSAANSMRSFRPCRPWQKIRAEDLAGRAAEGPPRSCPPLPKACSIVA